MFVETVKNLRVAAGAAYSKGGFDPTVGLQYIFSGKKLMFLCAPRINIDSEPSYDIMNIFQFKTPINKRINLFTKAKFLNVFDAKGNIKSFQWFRLGSIQKECNSDWHLTSTKMDQIHRWKATWEFLSEKRFFN